MSAQAILTKYHRLDGNNNNRHLLLTVLEAGKSQTMVPVSLVFGENLCGSWLATFPLHPHMTQREQFLSFQSIASAYMYIELEQG